ncbi:MAG TPA: hypothetical protein VEI26_10905, partial [Terriglobales bacterium]|nr:hypothetical protein [Terriglobales bacterium]
MKVAGRKCSFSFLLAVLAILLAAVPLAAQQAPAPAGTSPASTSSDSTKAITDKLTQLDKDVKAAQSA